jgi:hypothetical protein
VISEWNWQLLMVTSGTMRQRRAQLAVAGTGMLILLAGGITWGIMASQPARPAPAWQPASITNLVLLEGPESLPTGTDYHPIATRAEDPALLSTDELAKVFRPGKYGGPSQVSADCAGAVTGKAVARALRAAGCSQVLRLITSATGTTGPSVVQVDIFNLAGGPSLIAAARAFGEEPSYGVEAFPSQPPNSAPGGFILPWRGTEAAGVARAGGNAADVDAFGHFLVVVWTYSTGSGGPDGAAELVNGMVELELSQWADNRAVDAADRHLIH